MGLHRCNIYRHDVGLFAPNAEHLRRAALTLCFPQRFFLGDDIGELTAEAANFRSGSKLSARQRDIAVGCAAVAAAFNGEIERFYALPEPDFPDLAHRREPEQAAEFVRGKWSLGDRPIESMLQLLESKGVRIFSLPAGAREADTFSLWHRNQAYVLLNPTKPRDAQRFDLALELGHLILNRQHAPADPHAQRAAGAFAAALLMPPGPIRSNAPTPLAIDFLVALARKWGAPPEAVARRLYGLEALSAWQYRRLGGDIAVLDRAAEHPTDSRQESSLFWQRVFTSLRGRRITKPKIARAVHIYPKDLNELVFGMMAYIMDASTGADATVATLRPRVAVVTSTE